jgi:hypothetical protein
LDNFYRAKSEYLSKNSQMLVTSIVTRLPPIIDGVGDHAFNLALKLRQDFDIETHFIVGDPTWTEITQIEGFSVSKIRECSTKNLLSMLQSERFSSTPILLHYVNYGYAKRGCPVWLVDALQSWRTKNNNRSLVTMFHETYASGPPWTSSFWLSPLQKKLAARLVKMSTHCLTSRENYAKVLSQLSLGKHTQIPTLPVFSNIGEPEQVPPLVERSKRLVIFGSPTSRRRVYQESFAELERTCELLEIEEILDIGTSTNLTLSTVNKVPVVEFGQRSASEISHFLLNSLVGFFDYNPEYLAKSGIFAAYCAHGLLPVSNRPSAFLVDGLEAGKHYWFPDKPLTGLKELVELQTIANNAYAWYQTHNLSVQSKTFAALLTNKN